MEGKNRVNRRLLPSRIKWSELFSTVRFTPRSFALFLLIGGMFFGLYYYIAHRTLNAASLPSGANQLELNLNGNGNLYLGTVRLNAEVFKTSNTYRYRYQVINQPKDFVDTLVVDVKLPKAATTQTVGFDFITNGGADTATAQLVNPTTIEYTASGITTQAQLAIEFEVPQSFVSQSALFGLQQSLSVLPTVWWLGLSIALPSLTFLILLLVAMGRLRQIEPSLEKYQALPSRLPPAILGILWRGRLTNRELAATFLDLARRGHLVIRQVSANDFRFRRNVHPTSDKLYDYEQELLTQIFGPESDQANTDEISFALAQEVFSTRVSQSFLLAYKRISDLGYFYTNPLALHRRYQIAGIVLFGLGAIGFVANLVLITSVEFSLFFWVGMMISALCVMYFARGLPVRTLYGDRELAKWMSFRDYLTSDEPINYAAQTQEKFLAYLPYAVIFEVEREWTKRFLDLPFAQPDWYVAPNISTIEDFANQIFPLFGYLSHALALTAQPATQ